MVEVSRQTGFGLQELFGGEISSKPTAPTKREEKIAFLQQWIDLTRVKCGESESSLLSAVSPENIVCGQKPMLTNMLLQYTSAAAWPEAFAVPRFVQAASE